MYKRKQTECVCQNCGKVFMKNDSDIKFALKKGRTKFCCSLKCNGIFGNPKTGLFTYIFNSSRKRKIKVPFNITKEDLEKQWELQNGKCIYTGVDLILPNNTNIKDINHIYRASLDRIDSEKGYEKNNIQFISLSMNYMKHVMSHEDTILLCKKIADNHKNLIIS